MRKWRNTPTVVDGVRFASKLEARRSSMLDLLQRARGIAGLERQVSFPLRVADKLICTIRWDFSYLEEGRRVVDDSKGKATPDWIIKAKLFAALHPDIEVRINGVATNFWA